MYEQLPDWPPHETASDYFGMSKRQWIVIGAVYAMLILFLVVMYAERERIWGKHETPPAPFSDRFDNNWITAAPVAPQVLAPPVVADGPVVSHDSPTMIPPIVVVPNDSISTMKPMEELVPHDPHPEAIAPASPVALPHISSIQIEMHRVPEKPVRAAKVAVVKRTAPKHRHHQRHSDRLRCIPWEPCQIGLAVYIQDHPW